MERKIESFFRKWQKDIIRKPLILYGPKQIGKTFTTLAYGSKEYKNTIYFNTENNNQLLQLFTKEKSTEKLIVNLSLLSGETILPEDTLIIVALLHDICKTNFYKVDYRNAKNERGEWEKVPYYTIDDTIPFGHGEKSVMMLTEYIKLTPEEKYAIRWHMGFSEPKEVYNTLGAAFKRYPLALLLNEADLESTYFYDI